MNNISEVKKLRFWLSMGLVYAILTQILGWSYAVNDIQRGILLLIQVVVAFVSGKLAYEVSLNKNRSILIGILSLFFLINIFSIAYTLKKSNDYIKNNYQVGEEIHYEFYENKDLIKANHKYQDYEASNKTQIFLRIMIGLNILLTVLIAFLFITVNNNDMRIDVLTAQIEEYSAIVNIVDDSLNDEETVEVIEEMNEINNSDINKDNFEELIVSGHAIDKSNPYMFTVTGTITNNGDAEQKYDVQVIFYDKSNKPIALESDTSNQIKPSEINGFKVTLLDNVNNINSYEVKLVNKN